MSEREFHRPVPDGLPADRRGPAPPPSDAATRRWRDGEPPILGEHRDSIAEVEADVAYRWAAPAVAGRNVCVVGCATGHGIRELVETGGAAGVVGVDRDPRVVERATRLHGEYAKFVCAPPAAIPLAAGSFDAVLCFDEVESADDPDELIDGLVRLLAEGGLLMVSLPLTPPRSPVTGEAHYPDRSREDWLEVLGERFANLRVHRRRSTLGAVVVPEEGEPSLDEPRWLGGDAGEERSLLVIASDAELPDQPAPVSIIGGRDLRAYREVIAAWELRARRAEADGSAKHWELVASREAQRRLRKRLWQLEHTPLRRLVRILRGKPGKLSEGPPIRPPERDSKPWD